MWVNEMKECLLHTDKYSLNVLSPKWEGPVVLYISNKKFDNNAWEIYDAVRLIAGFSFVFCELEVNDWDKFLTPWATDGKMNNREFQGKGKELLTDIENEVIPELNKNMQSNFELYVAGYSLAGLFSLWSLYESDVFDGAVCCSGSLWYPGWKEYAAQSIFLKPVSVYISLGKKEENTKHPLMKTVGENTRLQYELLNQDENVKMLHMDLNEGGHFSNVEERIVMGIRWILA